MRRPDILFLANWSRTHRATGDYAFFTHWRSRPRVRFFGTFSLGAFTRWEKNRLRFYLLQPLLALLRAPFYDAVIAFSSQSGLPFAALLRLCFWMKTKLIVFDVESFGRAKSGMKLRLVRFGAKRIDHVIYAARAQATYYEDYLPFLRERSTFVPLGIGVPAQPPIGDAGRRGPLLALGKHGRAFRDWATLLRAYAALENAPPLQIVGRADLPAAERENVAIPPGVELIDYLPLDRLRARIVQARAILLPLPEREQSLGQLSLLLSMALGKAVVASRIIGLTDYLRDGETGLFYIPGDANDLARALRELLADPTRAIAMGRAARRAVEEQFNDERMGRRWEEIFFAVTNLPR
ncbi:MAG TPA: glycosyltransferase family 4 protein [bacterium]|nr:glycosyltransferase family 4 protein [bacterium]